MLKQRNCHRFRFVDPYSIGYVPPADGKVMKENQTNHRAEALAKRLVGTSTDQLCLVPCNVGEHWIFTVIDPHKEEICLFDPLYQGNNDKKWQEVVNMAIQIFFAQTKKKSQRKSPIWKVIKAPKQPDLEQCGFFVLRYMRQITQFDGPLDMASMQSLFMEGTYTKAQLDEVRSEWAERMQLHIIE